MRPTPLNSALQTTVASAFRGLGAVKKAKSSFAFREAFAGATHEEVLDRLQCHSHRAFCQDRAPLASRDFEYVARDRTNQMNNEKGTTADDLDDSQWKSKLLKVNASAACCLVFFSV